MKFDKFSSIFASVGLVLLLACIRPAIGQEATEEKVETVERTIYVPFDELREVFEKEGRGVFLPYDQFEKLWNAAQVPIVVSGEGPPVDAVITSITNEARVEEDVVRVSATLTIELLKQGWNRVPLSLNDVAILSATIGDEVARIMPVEGGTGYLLLVENEGKAAKRIELQLTYARAYEKSPGRNRVAFMAPQAPVNRWLVRIPQVGVKVNIDPMIAASDGALLLTAIDNTGQNDDKSADGIENSTEAPDGSQLSDIVASNTTDANGTTPDQTSLDETVLVAFVGAAPQVTIDWTPKAEGATGLDALISVQAEQELFITEGALRTRANLAYEISRAQVAQLKIEVPSDHKVINVFDPNIRKWEVANAADDRFQQIVIELFEPASGEQKLTIELEKFYSPLAIGQINEQDVQSEPDPTSQAPSTEIAVPTIRAIDVGRQRGTVVVQIDPALRVEATQRTGLLQIDASELPATLASRNWAFAYRYAALPFSLDLNIEKIEPRITVQQLVETVIEPELLTLDVVTLFDVEQAGIFQFEFQLPPGYEVLQVAGRSVAGATEATVDRFSVDGQNRERLIVNLGRKALGRVGLFMRLEQRVVDPNLLAPTGNSSTYTLAVPQPKQDYLAQATGKLVVYSPESLRLTPVPTGLRPIALSEAFTTIPSSLNERAGIGRATVAYEFAEPLASLQVAVERRRPYVTARQRLLVEVDEGVVKYDSVFAVEVLYSGIKSLRIDVPTEIASDIRNRSATIRDARMNPQPADVPEGFTAWEFTGETELLGNVMLELNWERKISELAVGSSLILEVPRLKPMGTDRAWGQIMVTKSEALDVAQTGNLIGLRPIDPNQDVMSDLRVPNVARAFEFYDDWKLQLQVTRYQLEEVKRTSIERALVRNVVTRSGHQNVQALVRIRSARQRLTLRLPIGAEFDTQPVRINGAPVALERTEQDLLTIPLTGQDPNRPFVLDLRYSLIADGQYFDVPEFPEEPAVQKVYFAIFLPDEIKLLRASGAWTDEFEWVWDDWETVPRPMRTDEELANWVSEGINMAAGPLFQKDGTLLMFSALSPESSPVGTLRLLTINELPLKLTAIGVLAVLGLLFLPSSIGVKLTIVTLMSICVVACGVFAPTLGQQFIGLPTLAGLTMVGIAWGGWHSYQLIRRLHSSKSATKTLDQSTLETGTTEPTEHPQSAMDATAQNENDSATSSQRGDQDA